MAEDALSLKIVGQRLRARRQERKQSQQDLAKVLHAPQSWISELETGAQQGLEANTIYRLCRALECSADYLMGLTDDPAPPKRARRKRPAAAVPEEERLGWEQVGAGGAP